MPGLATGYEISADKLTWTFTLRDDVKMQDGSTFTAADVKTAVDRIVAGADFTHLADVQVLRHRRHRRRRHPRPGHDEQAVRHAGHRHAGADRDRLLQPGRRRRVPQERRWPPGPWKFVSQALNANVKYERFDDYWDPSRKPNFKKLVFQIVPDESSRVAGVQTGDARHRVRPHRRRRRRSSRATTTFKIIETKGTGLAYCMVIDNDFPDEDSPLKNLDVRKALLDGHRPRRHRQVAVRRLRRGRQQPDPERDARLRPRRQAAALRPRRRPRSCSARPAHAGLSLTLNSYNATSTIPDIQKLAETVASLWTAIGVDVTLNLADVGTILPAWRDKQLHGRRDHRRAGVLLLRAGAPHAVVLLDDRRLHDGRATPSSTPSPTQINQETRQGQARPSSARQLSDLLDEQLWGMRHGRRLVAGGHRPERRQLDDHQGLPVRRRSPGCERSSDALAALHPRPAGPGRSSCCGSSSPSCSCSAGRAGNIAELMAPPDAPPETVAADRGEPRPRQAAHRAVRPLHRRPRCTATSATSFAYRAPVDEPDPRGAAEHDRARRRPPSRSPSSSASRSACSRRRGRAGGSTSVGKGLALAGQSVPNVLARHPARAALLRAARLAAGVRLRQRGSTSCCRRSPSAAYPLASLARLTRSAVIEVLRQGPHAVPAGQGRAGPQRADLHTLRNASLPIVTLAGIQLGYLFSGAVVIETLFAWPGVGQLAIQGINSRDYPVVQGVVLVNTLLFVRPAASRRHVVRRARPRVRRHARGVPAAG